MNDSCQSMQDQRKNSGMEDSTAMTIEFLRARLLAERSVSRTAKQRGDELSKRVAELEEQLKIVSLQRKRAEKATADVLVILESQEMSDLSEDYDSSSEQKAPHESLDSGTSVKEKESSGNLKVRRNESEDFSGSERDSSRLSGGNLSWKGCKGTSHSIERRKGSSMRRQTSLPSTSSSPRHHIGKLCRHIRRRESRSAAEESKNGSTKVDAQENGAATSSKGFMNFPNGGPDSIQTCSQIQEENVSANLDSRRSITNGSGYYIGKEMERALEHQAQLIGQYEEMEKAQREWEEKFRENNNSTPDSCDPGNYSDITEEREEIKAQAQSHSGMVTTKISQNQEVKSQAQDVCFTKELSKATPNGFELPLDTDTRHLLDHKDNHRSQGSGHHAHYPGSRPAHKSASSHEAETSGSQNNLYALGPHQKTEGLGGVLDALKHARLSLQQKVTLNGSPIPDGAVVQAQPSVPATKTTDRGEIPVGCTGLFRLPTDFPVEAHTQAKTLDSGTQLSFSNYCSDRGISSGEQYLANSYMDTRSIVPTTQTQNPYFDPSTSRFTYSSYPDPMAQMPANAGSSRHITSSRMFGMPHEDRFSGYDDHIRQTSLYR